MASDRKSAITQLRGGPPMLFAVSENVQLAIVGVFVILANGIVGVAMLVLKERFDRQRAAAAAAEVKEVKTVLAKSTEESGEKLSAIHTLVNSNRGETLTIASVALDRVAELTKHPKDVAAAAVAKKLLREHEAQQALVDKRDNAGTTLRQDVAAIPEKTATKVVEKLKEEPQTPH